MRTGLSAMLLVLLALVSGCGATRLQREVDQANRQQLELLDERSYLFMQWDDAPKDWLLVTDVRLDNGYLIPMHAMLSFHQERLALSSRVAILDGKEITLPGAGFPPSPETLAQRAAKYREAHQQTMHGRKWVGATFTTNIHPMAVDYRALGAVEYRGREVRVLQSRVLTSRSQDPTATYEYADLAVGLDAKSGRLVFEYLASLRPKTDAANHMLVVHDSSHRMRLSRLIRMPPDERAGAYEELRRELAALSDAVRMAILQATTGAGP